MQVDALVHLFAGLAATQPARPASGNEANLATWRGGPLHRAGLANVLVVASTEGMFHRLQRKGREVKGLAAHVIHTHQRDMGKPDNMLQHRPFRLNVTT